MGRTDSYLLVPYNELTARQLDNPPRSRRAHQEIRCDSLDATAAGKHFELKDRCDPAKGGHLPLDALSGQQRAYPSEQLADLYRGDARVLLRLQLRLEPHGRLPQFTLES
jgi:hypothetical protein